MHLYSQNKQILIELEKLIHEERPRFETNYRCNKWAIIEEHQNGIDFAFAIDDICLIILKEIPEDVEVLQKLPDDFYPKFDFD